MGFLMCLLFFPATLANLEGLERCDVVDLLAATGTFPVRSVVDDGEIHKYKNGHL